MRLRPGFTLHNIDYGDRFKSMNLLTRVGWRNRMDPGWLPGAPDPKLPLSGLNGMSDIAAGVGEPEELTSCVIITPWDLEEICSHGRSWDNPWSLTGKLWQAGKFYFLRGPWLLNWMRPMAFTICPVEPQRCCGGPWWHPLAHGT